MEEGGLRVLPLGGLGEIGRNCLVLEYRSDILVVDCGVQFSDLDHFGVQFAIPDLTYLIERKDRIRAFIITHGHEDHTGALPFALKCGIRAPIFASPFACRLIEERFKQHGLTEKSDLIPYQIGDTLELGSFKVRTVSVNHSIVDAAALIIDTPVGRVVHTGDFKIDPTPFYGSTIDLERFKQAGDEGVLLLLSDSTNVERLDPTLSEEAIFSSFDKLFWESEGLTVVSLFASNIARIGQVLTLAKEQNKRVFLSGRGMNDSVRLAREAGYVDGVASVLIDSSQIKRVDRRDLIVLATGSQAEYRSSLIRIAKGEDPDISLQPGDRVLLSSRIIPGREKLIWEMVNDLFRQGAQVLYESVHCIHTSGHATRPELERMLRLVRPKFFMPIHGEYRHLVKHAELAEDTGVRRENIFIGSDGDCLELTASSFRKIGTLENTRILLDGRQEQDIPNDLLKSRRKLGEHGIVFPLLVRNEEKGTLLSPPTIVTKGVVSRDKEAALCEMSQDLVRRIVTRHVNDSGGPGSSADLEEEIRIELRRMCNHHLGRKPTVVPIVIDV